MIISGHELQANRPYELIPGYCHVIIDKLFSRELFAWYVVEIEIYGEDEIEGTLLTTPFEIYGPYASFEEACTMMQTLCSGSTNLDNFVDAT